MGENGGRGLQPENGLLPNGLLINDVASVIQPLDPDRWSMAEQRTAELIKFIKPNKPSEELRSAVANYVQRLIMSCFPCQVFTFGSVPLKTYLPDGDIDLTTFSNNEMKETWAHQVRDTLENEEKNENAEFRVKEVQYIQAEVKIIKCLVENIVVDISFNQLGGLCTLCFLEEVDNLISQDHLFKRSIILIKAWCYYESRVLGAHHGLISTYALETLVLYIFHVFNNSFTGPLEVLYRFLEFFSKFDWDNFCISLWGPVPLNALPDVSAEPPRKDGGELLLSKPFLEACSAVYAVFPSGQENQSQPFVSKYFNVIDPLRVNNNLGRSVSKGNFFRIRSAFAFGAKKLSRLLDCSKDDICLEVSQFFVNTWDRHGNGQRPDVPRSGLVFPRLQNPGQQNGYEMGGYVSGNRLFIPTNNDSVMDQKNSVEISDSKTEEATEKATKKPKDYSGFDMGRYLFVRTRSSPELTEGCSDISSQGRRGKAFDSKKHQSTSMRSSSSQNRSPDKDILPSHIIRSSYEELTTSRHDSLQQCLDATSEVSSVSKSFQDLPSPTDGDNLFPSVRMHEMNQDQQDMVNMMAAPNSVGFCSQFHAPMNMSAGQIPISFPPILSSVGCNQRNIGVLPPNIPLIDAWGTNPHLSKGLLSPHLAHYFSGLELTSNPDDPTQLNQGFIPPNPNLVDGDHTWQDRPSSGSRSPSMVGFTNTSRNRQRTSKESWGSRDEHEDADLYNDEKFNKSLESSSSIISSRNNGKIPPDTSMDGTSSRASRMSREKKGKRTSAQEKSKGLSDSYNDEDRDWNANRNPEFPSVYVSSGSEPMIPLAPMILGHGSNPKTSDNAPLTFYPTGPPVPFVTMLPFYNFPSEAGSGDAPSSPYGVDGSESAVSSDVFEPAEISSRSDSGSAFVEQRADILNSDFASHWQNLQYGRFCQSSRHPSPVIYQSPLMVPPVYLHGRYPLEAPGRPNTNVFSQIMTYGNHFLPVAPLQPLPNPHNNQFDDLPRYRSGTGTYLPSPKTSYRERHGSSRKGNYSDHTNEREGNWNAAKSRASRSNNNRHQTSSRHDRNASYPSQNGSVSSDCGPPMVMYYPHERTAPAEHLEFGTFGQFEYPDNHAPRG